MANILGDTKRKVAFFGRHGKAPKHPQTGASMDSIEPQSFSDMYDDSMANISPLVEVKATPENASKYASLLYSNMVRAQLSGLDRLAGIFHIPLNLPITPEQLRNNPYLSSVSQQVHPSLCYEMDQVNGKTLLAMEKQRANSGAERAVNFWLTNPNVNIDDGEKIAPFDTYMAPRAVILVQDIVKALTDNTNPKTLVGAIGHGPFIDPTNVVLARSGGMPVREIAEIGGATPMSGYTILQFDYAPASGSISNQKFTRAGMNLPVDLNRIMNEKPIVTPYK